MWVRFLLGAFEATHAQEWCDASIRPPPWFLPLLRLARGGGAFHCLLLLLFDGHFPRGVSVHLEVVSTRVFLKQGLVGRRLRHHNFRDTAVLL